MAPLPLLKIFAVLFKEISKPIASSIKRQAVDHPQFKALTMSLGRSWENGTQRVERLFSGNKEKTLKPVTDAQALHQGADLISQGFLLSTAIGLVCFEYWRGLQTKEEEKATAAAKKAKRVAVKEARLQRIEDDITGLTTRMQSMEAAIQQLEAQVQQQAQRGARPGGQGGASAAEHSQPSVQQGRRWGMW